MRAFIPALAIAFSLSAPAAAAEFKDYDATAVKAAQAQGKPILLDVKAWWCPTCASQGKKIKRITANPRYNQLVIFRIDYDKQKPVWQALGVQRQSTLIAYRGNKEVGRIVAETDEAKIAGLLGRAVQ